MATEIAPPSQASEALSKIRHDLKTPLNQIIGYTEMLIEDAEAAGRAEAETALRRLLDSARASLEIQERLLTRQPEELRPEHLEELKQDQTARSVYMQELLVELRAEPASKEWAEDLERLRIAASNLGTLARDAPAKWAGGPDVVSISKPALPPEPEEPAVWLPSAESAPSVQRTPSVGGRILVVDDNESNRDMLSKRLEREGYSVDTAANGREALEKLETGGFDLVLLDIVMPEVDGFTVLRSIRADPRWK
jgi:adenylate cyclase